MAANMTNAVVLTKNELTAMSRKFKGIRRKLLLRQVDLAEMMGISLPTLRKLECREVDAVSVNTLQRIREFEKKLATEKVLGEVMRVPR